MTEFKRILCPVDFSDASRHENKVIIYSFVVAIKQVKPKKSGEPYLALTLADRRIQA